MLRRKPTAITLTTEDIAIYEDARAREAAERKHEELKERKQSHSQGASELKPSQLTKHDRILGQGNSAKN
ncbi:hypothetical protein GcC1_176015 [Golovinomyces cichoracearum]|uniref:Anaphase-promoting complex subunit CDC26 n=1 Tax=Golovinomyces cichoracearum TaxID=62708 RepID=A0A420HPF9_9PEZI|nr:hypothetical protein GcC1_176015 [Golovinomyces cichoracearum]